MAHDRLRPYVRDWFEEGTLPVRDLALDFGKLGVLGMTIEGHDCPGMTATQYGVACAEVEAVDSGLRSPSMPVAASNRRHAGSR